MNFEKLFEEQNFSKALELFDQMNQADKESVEIYMVKADTNLGT